MIGYLIAYLEVGFLVAGGIIAILKAFGAL